MFGRVVVQAETMARGKAGALRSKVSASSDLTGEIDSAGAFAGAR